MPAIPSLTTGSKTTQCAKMPLTNKNVCAILLTCTRTCLFPKYRGRLTMKRNKGAQPGNRNALKHGFYSKVLTRSAKLCSVFPLPFVAIRFICHFSLIRFKISLTRFSGNNFFERTQPPENSCLSPPGTNPTP